MIRRLNKHSDLKDLIKSCPSGVIDDIYAIEYYIQGYNTVIQANFTKKETMLEVIIPSTDLETLPNGILMRRAYYKVLDASYPDGYYNLEFEDNMNVWIGENESEEPVIPEYVTEEELEETLEDYATEDWVEGQGYLTSASMSGYATEQWVDNELMTGGYLTEYMADQRYPTFNWISSASYATESWVQNQGYAVDDPNDPVITESALDSVLAGDDNMVVREDDLASYATQSWVEGQGYLTSTSLSGYATESYVQNQGYITSASLSGYATESWVQQQGYLDSNSTLPADQITCNISGDIFDFDDVDEGLTALVSKVEEQIDDISSLDTRVTDLENAGYATQTWVGQQGYITSSALSGYATESWATNQFLEESKVWTGTETQWNQLSAAQKASYTIALITQ